MELPDYISKVGDKAFADKFGVTERAARSWRLRERYPRREVAQRIAKATPVTWEGIYMDRPRTAANRCRCR